MKDVSIIPIDHIEKVSNLELEKIINNKLNCGLTITAFEVIEIRNQSVSEFISYLIKNLEDIDCILITPTELITCKFK